MMKKIKLLALLLMMPLIFNSCKIKMPKLTKFGTLSVASTKNMDLDADYVLLARNAGVDQSQVSVVNRKGDEIDGTRRSRTRKRVTRKTRKKIKSQFYQMAATTVDKSIENVVEATAGGMFMENVELYSLPLPGNKFGYVVSGDVYGKAGASRNIRGYNVGTKAIYKKMVGTVVTLTNDQYCLWKNDKTGKFTEVLYDDLLKIGE